MTQFVGSKVSIITKSSNRFEGRIESLDVAGGVLVLVDVKVFGTEDRQVERFCPPKDTVFKSIGFKASEIADITVLEKEAESDGFVGDPAIVSCGDEVSDQSSVASPPGASHPPPARVYGGGAGAASHGMESTPPTLPAA